MFQFTQTAETTGILHACVLWTTSPHELCKMKGQYKHILKECLEEKMFTNDHLIIIAKRQYAWVFYSDDDDDADS